MNHPQIRSRWLALLSCLLLVACATPPEKVERADTPSVKIDETAMLPLLGYLQLLNRMTPQELLRERSMLTSIPQTPATQVRLALLLGQPRAPTDLGRALSLLDSVLKSSDPVATNLQPLARLLANQYGERQKLQLQNEKLQVQAEKLQIQVDKLNAQNEKQAQQLNDSQRQTSELQDKLDALANIERSLPVRTPHTPPGEVLPGAGR